MKQQTQNVVIIAGLVLLVLVVAIRGGVEFPGSQSLGFLGALLQVCDNHEAVNLTEHSSLAAYYGGVLTAQGAQPKTLTRSDNTSIAFTETTQTYTFPSGAYTVHSFTGLPVGEYKDYLRDGAASAAIVTHNTKTALVADGTYWWSNRAETLLMSGDEPGFVAYTNAFIQCRAEENKTAQQLACEAKGVGYDPYEDRCVCPGEQVWSATNGCHTPAPVTSTSRASTATAAQSTTSVAGEQDNRTAIILIVILLVAGLIYYVVFERGDNRGLIGKGFRLRR